MSDKVTEALEVHSELNPVLWDGMELKEEVKNKLLEIANTFIEGLDYPLNVADIRFLGSNASFNYNDNSDIDLHIISNFELSYVDKDILQILYNASKNSFNNHHDITIKGIPVEVYVEDMNSMNATNGAYSLIQDEWVMIPKPVEYTIPDYSKELQEYLGEIDYVMDEGSKEEIEDLINRIYLGRKDGLATEGEVSIGNCVFKELRNMGWMEKLREKFYELESQELTLENKLVEAEEIEDKPSDDEIVRKEEEYKEYIRVHIENVRKAYDRIVKQFIEDEFSKEQIEELENNLKVHDEDKSIPFIFDAYRRNHYPVNEQEKQDAEEDYDIAWFYHKKNNPHHWEYWLDGDGFFSDEDVENSIKIAYAEMLCDWLSFGFRKEKKSATGESTEFETWYKSATDIQLHPLVKDWMEDKIQTIIEYIRENKDEIYADKETEGKHLTNFKSCGITDVDNVNANNREVGDISMIENDKEKLEEGGLSRVLQLMQEGYFATVSGEINITRYAYYVACDKDLMEAVNDNYSNWNALNKDVKSELENKLTLRYGNELEQYNKEIYSQLKSYVRGLGFGYMPIDGVYTYADGETSTEKSLFVSASKENRTTLEAFRKDVLNIGKTFYQESMVIGNTEVEKGTKSEDGRLKINASLYDCQTGKVLKSNEYSTEYNAVKLSDFGDFISRLKCGKEFSAYNISLTEDYVTGIRPDSLGSKMIMSAMHESVNKNINKYASIIQETYKRNKKLLESNYDEFKQQEGFVYDYEVKVPLKIEQLDDIDSYEDDLGNDIDMNIDIDSMYDELIESESQIQTLFNDEDWLKDIFPNVGRGRVYPDLVSLEEYELIFRIGFSDIIDPVERGNDIHLDRAEIEEQLKDLTECIIDNLDLLSVKQSYDVYSGYKDEDDDPIYDTEYSDDTVAFQVQINGDIQIKDIKNKLTEGKDSYTNKIKKCTENYQVAFIEIDNNSINDLEDTKLPYLWLGDGYKDNSYAVVNELYSNNIFQDLMLALANKYNQENILVSYPDRDVYVVSLDGSITESLGKYSTKTLNRFKSETVDNVSKSKEECIHPKYDYTREDEAKRMKDNMDNNLYAMRLTESILNNTKSKLEESNLSRIYQHYQNNPFLIISAMRDDPNVTDKDNKRNTLNLQNDIRSKGFGYIPFDGMWKEGNNDPSSEDSFFVPAIHTDGTSIENFDDFFKWAIELCRKYNQYSVLISNGQGDIAYYDRNGNITESDSTLDIFNNIAFNRSTIDANIKKTGTGGYTSLNKKNPNKSFQLQKESIEPIRYKSTSYSSHSLNSSYNKIVELKSDDTDFDMLKKYVDADYGYFSARDLHHIIKVIYNEDVDFEEGTNTLTVGDAKITYTLRDASIDGIKVDGIKNI